MRKRASGHAAPNLFPFHRLFGNLQEEGHAHRFFFPRISVFSSHTIKKSEQKKVRERVKRV